MTHKHKGNGKTTILVNQKPHHIDSETVDDTVLRQLAVAPDEYEAWKVIKSPDPEGQLPVDDVQVTQEIAVKSGDRFRVVPPGTFGCP
jgi:hypothetical protein